MKSHLSKDDGFFYLKSINQLIMDKKNYGYKLTFSGFQNTFEIESYIKELKSYMEEKTGDFGIMVELRQMKPLAPESQEALTTSQKLVATRLTRSATIVNDNAIIKMQFKRLSKQSGVADSKRFIDTSSNTNWEKLAENWIAKGIEPYPLEV